MANALTSDQRFSFTQPPAATEKSLQSTQSLFDLLKPAIHLLLEKGIRLLVVTLGSDGVFLCFGEVSGFLKDVITKEEKKKKRKLYQVINRHCPSIARSGAMNSNYFGYHLPAPAAAVASLSGAGDCLVGGMLSALCSGLDVMQSAAVGVAVAKAAVEAFDNVPAEISLDRIASDAQRILSAAEPLVFDDY